jgi:hypothetical protein
VVDVALVAFDVGPGGVRAIGRRPASGLTWLPLVILADGAVAELGQPRTAVVTLANTFRWLAACQ